MKRIQALPPAKRVFTRRGFLATAGAASTLLFVPGRVLGLDGETSPNNKLNIAGIGIGGQGGEDLKEMTSENIMALCDVDTDHAAHTFKKYPKAKVHKDFRQMLDKEKGIDAIVCGGSDHNHAIISMTAIKHGKARLLRSRSPTPCARPGCWRRRPRRLEGRDANEAIKAWLSRAIG